MKPKIEIVILNWNGKKDTIECLSSLKKINYTNHKITVVDNGSGDDSAAALKRKFPCVRLIRISKNQGYAEGNNVGIKKALSENPDYILLLNNDTIVDENFLGELIKVAESNKKTGIVCPKVYFYHKPNIIQFAGLKFDIKRGSSILIGHKKEDKGQFDSEQEMDFCGGVCMLVKKEVFKKIGLFDKSYFAYFEDTDFGFRARKKGYKIILAPNAKIWHKVSASTGGQSNPAKEYYMSRNQIWFMKKHANKSQLVSFSFYLALNFICSFLSFLKEGRIDMISSRIRGSLEGVF